MTIWPTMASEIKSFSNLSAFGISTLQTGFSRGPVHKSGDNLWISFRKFRVLISRPIPAQDDLRGGSRLKLAFRPPLEIVSVSQARIALSRPELRPAMGSQSPSTPDRSRLGTQRAHSRPSQS